MCVPPWLLQFLPSPTVYPTAVPQLLLVNAVSLLLEFPALLQEFWKLYCSGIVCGKGEPKLVGDATTGVFSGVEAM